MGYENLSIGEAHHPICPKPSRHPTYLHPAFSWMENGTWGISPPSSIVPLPQRAQMWDPGSLAAVDQHILTGGVPKALSRGPGEGTWGSGSPSSRIHLHSHSEWPDGFLQNNMFTSTVLKTLSAGNLFSVKDLQMVPFPYLWALQNTSPELAVMQSSYAEIWLWISKAGNLLKISSRKRNLTSNYRSASLNAAVE